MLPVPERSHSIICITNLKQNYDLGNKHNNPNSITMLQHLLHDPRNIKLNVLTWLSFSLMEIQKRQCCLLTSSRYIYIYMQEIVYLVSFKILS